MPATLALVTLAAVHWFHECWPGDHAACLCHYPGIADSCGRCSGGKAGSGDKQGAVAGDQLPTDGILAYRLGFTFLHYTPKLTGVPLAPALMHRWAELVRPVLFRRSAIDR